MHFPSISSIQLPFSPHDNPQSHLCVPYYGFWIPRNNSLLCVKQCLFTFNQAALLIKCYPQLYNLTISGPFHPPCILPFFNLRQCLFAFCGKQFFLLCHFRFYNNRPSPGPVLDYKIRPAEPVFVIRFYSIFSPGKQPGEKCMIKMFRIVMIANGIKQQIR